MTKSLKNNRAIRKLIGSVVVASATYAIEKYIASRKKKKKAKKQ